MSEKLNKKTLDQNINKLELELQKLKSKKKNIRCD